ncbi:GntR family transcriptional regulator [Pseudohalocynthiibacter aestuariivivens]|uniref:GntR family transcriptional regulator n=1 Tax=Roseovarius pelagicus TaxID=2980108 RepID=A0ABY6DCK8_9RHOB|nr:MULTISPECIES: GntR family transcriptional regulator [Rhodobacterales]QIE44496.1 GntR family transcriptional regulator [Pseudohalocynthiibacter aestuariivivens]UXX83604.1 GntR family transcriptional regulator [Roseovarius pelagicus]
MGFKSVNVAQTKSATQIIFDALRQAIILGELEDSAPLRQEEIAKAFNTSRIPVREAIARLEQLGLVETRRYKGAVVAAISIEEFNEIIDLRSVVESDAIRRAVPLMTKETCAKARSHFENFAVATKPEAWTALNRQFHCCLYEAGRSPNYLGVINRLLDRVDRYLRTQLSLSGRMETATQEHECILLACEAGDADRAAALTYDHVQGVKTSLGNYLKSKRERAC